MFFHLLVLFQISICHLGLEMGLAQTAAIFVGEYHARTTSDSLTGCNTVKWLKASPDSKTVLAQDLSQIQLPQ